MLANQPNHYSDLMISSKQKLNQIMASQRSACKKRGMAAPKYSREEFIEWMYNNGYEKLYTAWKSGVFDHMDAPSVDRLDDSKTYSLGNIRLVTWRENKFENYERRKSGHTLTSQCKAVVQKTKCGQELCHFASAAIAGRTLFINTSHIREAAAGSRKSAGGFVWQYTCQRS